MFLMIHLKYIFKSELRQIEREECLDVIMKVAQKALKRPGTFLTI